MKRDRKTIWPMLLTAFALIYCPIHARAESSAGKVTMEDVTQKAKDLLDTLSAYSAEQREKAMQQIQPAIESLDKRLDELEDHIDRNYEGMSAEARRRAEAARKQMHKLRVELAEWYGGLKNGSGDTWEQLKTGFAGSFEKLSRAWLKAEKEISEEKGKD